MYGCICKLKLGWDGACSDQLVETNSRKFLSEVLEVCNTLNPVERAWVPIGFEFEQIICPDDGGEQGFAAHGYVRSQDVATREAAADSYCSRFILQAWSFELFGCFPTRTSNSVCNYERWNLQVQRPYFTGEP